MKNSICGFFYHNNELNRPVIHNPQLLWEKKQENKKRGQENDKHHK